VERKWKERYSQKFRRRAVARMNACDNIGVNPDFETVFCGHTPIRSTVSRFAGG